MEKYTVGSQTFLLMDATERLYMAYDLVAMQTIVNEFGEPAGWNDEDRHIFTGMLKLNSPIGFQDLTVMTEDQFGLGVDPTTDQFKKANIAIGKLIARYGSVGITRLSGSGAKPKTSSTSVKARMDDRRAELLKWVQSNQFKLQQLALDYPRLEKNICHNEQANDRVTYSKIRDLIAPYKPAKVSQSAEDAIAHALDPSLWA